MVDSRTHGAVVRMLDEDAYCIDVIKQKQAIQKAIDKLTAVILEKHLHSCLTTAIRSHETSERERVIAQLMDVFDTAAKI